MAVKKKKVTSVTTKVHQGEICYAPLEHIVEHPELDKLYRPVDRAWVNELTEDISHNTLDVPLITWAGGEEPKSCLIEKTQVDEPYYLIAGRHRRAALRQMAARTPKKFAKMFPDGIPVVYKRGLLAEVICTQLRENVQRKDMTPEEVFPVLKHLIEIEGLKQKDIASRIGKTEGWVSQMVLIDNSLPDDLKEATMAGELPVRDAQKIAREISKAKKEGKDITTDPTIMKRIETTKKKIERKKANVTAKKAAVRRLGAKAVRDLYHKLPNKVTMGARIRTLEESLDYIVGDADDLPKALAALHDEDVKAAEAKKAAKVAQPAAKKAAKSVKKAAKSVQKAAKAVKKGSKKVAK